MWTYGAEHELGDWDRRLGVPDRFGVDERDTTMVNSNGVAVDPKARMYPFGGEFNTPPCGSPMEQAEQLTKILHMHPNAVVNYRSNLHIHVRVPDITLEQLKLLAQFNDFWLPRVLPLVEPIPEPTRVQYPYEEEYQGARRRYRRRKKSHHTVMPHNRLAKVLSARTFKEFHDSGVPTNAEGKPLPYCQPRCAVNLRQLLETDTIEFRHFPGTLDAEELLTCIEWCRDYLACALDNGDPIALYWDHYRSRRWPQFPPYLHWMELRYRQTIHDGTWPKEELARNIQRIVQESADEYPSLVPR